jgi:hypothetical protein
VELIFVIPCNKGIMVTLAKAESFKISRKGEKEEIYP